MDGGRALRAFLAERVGSRRATETAARVGKGVALVMGLYGLFAGPFMLVFIAGFVWFAANAELSASRYSTSAYRDEVEVLGAPTGRGRPWRHRFAGSDPAARSGRSRTPDPFGGAFRERTRGARAPQRPVRVVVVHRGGWS